MRLSRSSAALASATAGALCLGLLACNNVDFTLTAFEGPMDAAVLPAGSIFDVTVGFVANARSGDITKLDLTRQGWLADTDAGTTFRGRPLATGRTRLLEHIAVYSSDDVIGEDVSTFITLFAADNIRESLLVVPYLDAEAVALPQNLCLNDPAEGPLFPRQPVCVAYDTTYDVGGESLPALEIDQVAGSTAQAFLTELEIVEGRTTTEVWTITWQEDFERFAVVGSLSGVQEEHAYLGEPYLSANSALGFTVYLDGGELKDGDGFTVSTDNGIIELPVPGTVQDLAFDASTGLLFATVQASDGLGGAEGHLIAVDAEQARTQGLGAELWEVPLPPGALPTRMDLVQDHTDADGAPVHGLYFSDPGAAGVVHWLDLDGAAVEDLGDRWQVLSVGFPNVDLALSRNPEVPWLYIGAIQPGLDAYESGRSEAFRVRIWDVAAGAEVDPNPNTPYITASECQEEYCPSACTQTCLSEPGDVAACEASCQSTCEDTCFDEGIPVASPIEGIAASLGPSKLATEDNAGRPYWDELIVVTTFAGTLYTVEASRGCLSFLDPRGAYLFDFSANFDTLAGVSLWEDPVTGRTAVGNRCGGITRSEAWTVRYDAAVGAWRVEGTISGEQLGLAYPDRRYISDGGEISFMLISGTQVPVDGDTYTLQMEDNVASASAFELPQDVTTYELVTGGSTAGWYDATIRQAAVVSSSGDDIVLNFDLSPALLSPDSSAAAHLALFN